MSELRGRCLYRATPKQPGKNIIPPYSWDTVVPKIPVETAAVRTLSTDEQLEVSTILCFIWSLN